MTDFGPTSRPEPGEPVPAFGAATANGAGPSASGDTPPPSPCAGCREQRERQAQELRVLRVAAGVAVALLLLTFVGGFAVLAELRKGLPR